VQINWDQTHAHARERLGEAERGHAEEAAALRSFLRLEGERLRMRHRFGLGGAELGAARSYVVDMLVLHACRRAARATSPSGRDGYAVVAVGGYGRAELAPGSDVDLLFLHDGDSPQVRGFVFGVLRLLWDAGLSVGHSFRTPRECAVAARADLHTRAALAEARFLTGGAALFRKLQLLMDALRADEGLRLAFLESLRRDVVERHAKHDQTVCAVEPNVKEGPGGLRDLHAVLWVAAACHGVRGLSALRDSGWLAEADHLAARGAYDFLQRVRHEAHFLSGRKADLLTLDLQGDLAAGLGYRARAGLLASELLMRDYYRRASELHRISEHFWRPRLRSRPRRPFEALRQPGRAARLPELRGEAGELLALFARAQAEDVAVSDALADAVRQRAYLVNRRFRASREAGRLLLGLLRQRGRVARVLRAMHATGVLGRLLPEFARVTFLIQHDQFHRYTVDEHTLRAIAALDELAAGCEPALARLGRAFDEIGDCAPLYLGMLLHDVGKGLGGGHVEKGVALGRRALQRLRIDGETASKALFLVETHLEMSRISQQRDLSEPGLIDAFAERVGSLERLNLLLLLTYADHRGVGPAVWNEWKAALLFDLYDRARERLAGAPLGAGARAAKSDAAAALRAEFTPEQVDHHFALLPERYLRTTTAARMVDHFRLLRAAPAAQVSWRESGGHWSELTFVGADRPGLLAALAGTLTAHGVDVLSVDVYTRADGLAIDTFHVAELASPHRSLRPERQQRVGAALLEAAAGRLDVAAALRAWRARLPRSARRHLGRAARPPRVRFDQQASAVATVVEVRAPDQPGLVYAITRVLAELGLDITFARVATAKALALDVFYVRDAAGRKLGPEAAARVETALLDALAGPRAVVAGG
jgi:[protein-PII] uridylyltransferase